MYGVAARRALLPTWNLPAGIRAISVDVVSQVNGFMGSVILIYFLLSISQI